MARKRGVTAGTYQVERIDDFSGGWSTEHPASLGKNTLSRAKNVMLTISGRVRPRWGMRKRFVQDFAPASVVGMGALRKSDGTTWLVIAAGTSLYSDMPHVEFIYDAQADWEKSGVYSNLDTRSESGAVRMYTPPQVEFLGTATYDRVWV